MKIEGSGSASGSGSISQRHRSVDLDLDPHPKRHGSATLVPAWIKTHPRPGSRGHKSQHCGQIEILEGFFCHEGRFLPVTKNKKVPNLIL